MRKRRQIVNGNETVMNLIDIDLNEDKNKNKRIADKQLNVECIVALILFGVTICIGFVLFMCYGHFILCWLNVGMCTPLIDVVTIAYQLSTNSSTWSIDNGMENTLQSNYDTICDLYSSAMDQNANFNLILVITYSKHQFQASNIFKMFQNREQIYLDQTNSTNEELHDIYQKYVLWRSKNQENGSSVYLKVMQWEEFMILSKKIDINRYIRCHQIGVMWLLNFDDDSDTELQSMLNNMTFYKYGGIRHSVIYYEHLHLHSYVNMVFNFLQIKF